MSVVSNVFYQTISKNHLQDYMPIAQIMFEIRLFVIGHLKTSVSIEYGWSVFTQYYAELSDEIEDQEIQAWIFKLRMLNHKYSTSSSWHDELYDYLNVQNEIRIYDKAEDGKLIRKTSKIFDSREDWYEEFLTNLPWYSLEI